MLSEGNDLSKAVIQNKYICPYLMILCNVLIPLPKTSEYVEFELMSNELSDWILANNQETIRTFIEHEFILYDTKPQVSSEIEHFDEATTTSCISIVFKAVTILKQENVIDRMFDFLFDDDGDLSEKGSLFILDIIMCDD